MNVAAKRRSTRILLLCGGSALILRVRANLIFVIAITLLLWHIV